MPLLSLSAGWQPASMAASGGDRPVPTKRLSLGDAINPTAWMNLLDDAPQAQVRMGADAQPEEAIRPYRALAAARDQHRHLRAGALCLQRPVRSAPSARHTDEWPLVARVVQYGGQRRRGPGRSPGEAARAWRSAYAAEVLCGGGG